MTISRAKAAKHVKLVSYSVIPSRTGPLLRPYMVKLRHSHIIIMIATLVVIF